MAYCHTYIVRAPHSCFVARRPRRKDNFSVRKIKMHGRIIVFSVSDAVWRYVAECRHRLIRYVPWRKIRRKKECRPSSKALSSRYGKRNMPAAIYGLLTGIIRGSVPPNNLWGRPRVSGGRVKLAWAMPGGSGLDEVKEIEGAPRLLPVTVMPCRR